ncbi:MAG: hypothetical protein IJO93_05305 [Clostridia bacterium]|nr:hypothetical protein [Clostridia bacterium]
MSIVFDILAVAAVVIFCIVGAKRGFVTMSVTLLKWGLAILLAGGLSTPIATGLYNGFVAEKAEAEIAEKLDMQSGVADVYEKAVNALPEGIEIMSSDSTFSLIKTETEKGVSLEHALCETVVRPAWVNLVQPICYVIIFAAVVLSCSLVGKVGKFVNYIPLVGQANKLFGAAAGALYGMILLFPLCAVLLIIVRLTQGSLTWMNMQTFENTYVIWHFMSVFVK